MKEAAGKAKLKVFLVLQNMGAGGAERVMANLANHLDKSRFEVELIVLANRGEFYTTIDTPEVRISDLKYTRVLFATPHIFWILATRRPDVVLSTLGHINIIMAILRPFFPRVRFIGREANIPSVEMPNQKFPRIMKGLFRFFYPRLDGVVCQSRDMRFDLIRSFGVPESKLHLIHNPADVGRIQRLAGEGGNPFPPGRRNILFVARMQPQKRPHLLVKLMDALSAGEPSHLHILGDGALRSEMETLFSRSSASARVTFWGVQKNPYRFMHYADILVVTSSHEGFPNVILEANACGLPVVAFRAQGVTEEILRDGVNGTLVEGTDIGAMAAAVRAWMARGRDGAAIKDHVARNFDVGVIIRQYERMLEGR